MPSLITKVQAIIQRIKTRDLSNTNTLIALIKLRKAASNAIADSTATRFVNQSLVDATKQRVKKKHQSQEDSNNSVYA
jgi:hypothetical protein